MKIKKELIKRNIAGDVILVPVGSASLDLKGLITLNEAAEVIWDALPEAESADDLVKAITGLRRGRRNGGAGCQCAA